MFDSDIRILVVTGIIGVITLNICAILYTILRMAGRRPSSVFIGAVPGLVSAVTLVVLFVVSMISFYTADYKIISETKRYVMNDETGNAMILNVGPSNGFLGFEILSGAEFEFIDKETRGCDSIVITERENIKITDDEEACFVVQKVDYESWLLSHIALSPPDKTILYLPEAELDIIKEKI